MAVYTYRAYDLMSGRFLMDLPVVGGSYTETVNEAGSFSLTAALGARQQVLVGGVLVPVSDLVGQFDIDLDLLAQATIPYRTAVYIDRDGVLQFGGIIKSRRPSSGGLALDGDGFLAYFARRKVRDDIDLLGTEQATIARTLFQYALGVTRNGRRVGDIGMTIAPLVTPTLRDVIMTGSDRDEVLDTVMTNCVNLSGGIDIGVTVAYDPATGQPTKTLRMWYPQRGVPLAQSTTYWEYEAGGDSPGGVIANYDWPEDGSRTITLALGKGDQTDFPVMSEVWADDLLASGWPLLEEEHKWDNNQPIEDQALLDERTRAFLDIRSGLVTSGSVTLKPGVDPGNYGIGDWCTIAITDPFRYPAKADGSPGMTAAARIIGRTITPAPGDGDEETSIDLHSVAAEQEADL